MAFVPICVQCGTRSNPCRCKVVGPTLGFVALVVAGVVEWPLGAAVYLFRHRKGRRIMGPSLAVARGRSGPTPPGSSSSPALSTLSFSIDSIELVAHSSLGNVHSGETCYVKEKSSLLRTAWKVVKCPAK
ncbi:hypothetical protein D1007_36820 [Hordeum vulgare]|nr:hypothetical protein D1007_36820 [Hordeum vulgare]